MVSNTPAVPQGMHTTPLRNVAQAIAVYKPAFGAQELGRSLTHDGNIMRAMIRIGASLFMMTDAFPNMACFLAGSLGGELLARRLGVNRMPCCLPVRFLQLAL